MISLGPLGRGGALTALAICARVLLQRQFFCHDNFRAARAARHYVEFVHEGAHQEDAAAGGAEKILFGERVGYIRESETSAFIEDMDDHFFAGEIDGQMNLFFGALLVAVMKSVDD